MGWLLLLLCLLPTRAKAAKDPAVTLNMGEKQEQVLLNRLSNSWVLMLPSGLGLDAVRSGTSVTCPDLGGEKLVYDMRVNVAVSGKQVQLRVLPSENTGSIFISLDHMKLSQFGDNKRRKDTGTFRLYDDRGTLNSEGTLTSFSLHGNSTLKAKKSPSISKRRTKRRCGAWMPTSPGR